VGEQWQGGGVEGSDSLHFSIMKLSSFASTCASATKRVRLIVNEGTVRIFPPQSLLCKWSNRLSDFNFHLYLRVLQVVR
jgi:hypothetical protein